MIVYPWYKHCMYGDNKVYPLYELTNPKIDNNWYIHCMYNDNKICPLYELTIPRIDMGYTLNMSDSCEIY